MLSFAQGENEDLQWQPKVRRTSLEGDLLPSLTLNETKVLRVERHSGQYFDLLFVPPCREANEVIPMPVEDLHARLKEGLPNDVQLMDVREPHEVEKSSLPGFKVYPLSKFGEWAPALDLDPKKETIVMVSWFVTTSRFNHLSYDRNLKKEYIHSGESFW